jgi:hypothetical protein
MVKGQTFLCLVSEMLWILPSQGCTPCRSGVLSSPRPTKLTPRVRIWSPCPEQGNASILQKTHDGRHEGEARNREVLP